MSARRPRHLALVALALSVAVAGCDEDECATIACSPCPRFATVVVTDAATGGPVSGAAVSGGGAPWTCAEADGRTRCTSFPHQVVADAFDVSVTAPGHAPGSARLSPVSQESGNCCPACLGYPEAVVPLTAS